MYWRQYFINKSFQLLSSIFQDLIDQWAVQVNVNEWLIRLLTFTIVLIIPLTLINKICLDVVYYKTLKDEHTENKVRSQQERDDLLVHKMAPFEALLWCIFLFGGRYHFFSQKWTLQKKLFLFTKGSLLCVLSKAHSCVYGSRQIINTFVCL